MKKLSIMVLLIICVTTLLVLNAFAVISYRDKVLSCETHKDVMLNFTIKYSTLANDLRSNAKHYINTGDESYRIKFTDLYEAYIINDRIELPYRVFTSSQSNQQLQNMDPADDFDMSSQYAYLGFDTREDIIYKDFQQAYLKLLNMIKASMEQKDMTLIATSDFDDLNDLQAEYMSQISKTYIDRLNIYEDVVLENQKILELILVFLTILLLLLATTHFYLISKENKYNSYFRQLYNTVFENVNVGLTIRNQQDRYEYTNPMYRKITGIDLADVNHLTPNDVLDAFNVAAIQASRETSQDNGGGQMILHVKSEERNIFYHHFTIQDENENDKFVSLIQDATEEERLKAQLKKQLDEIEYYSNAKDTFIANMSHEIRTPLNAILGMIHFMRSTELSDKQEDLLDKIENSSDALLSIINDVLDLSKVRKGSLNLYLSDFRLHDLLQNVGDMFSSQVRKKMIQWNTNYRFDPELCVSSDRTRLLQVMINLVSNAFKFTSEGAITISAEALSETDETITMRFSVSDTGIGIAAEDIPKLFQEFEQLENPLTKQHQGTGLGLAICKHIVSLMDGQLWVESTLGQGSCFLFEVTLTRGSSRIAPEELFVAKNLDGVGNKVLIVEDTELNIEVAEHLLADINITCDTAPDGLAAIKICKGKPADYYSLILMDIYMPKMDGYTASSILKNELGVKAPILALTAAAIDEEICEKHRGIISAFIQKPFKSAVFYQTIALHLPGIQIEKENALQPASPSVTVPCDAAPKPSTNPFSGKETAIHNLGGMEAIYYKHVAKFQTNYADSADDLRRLGQEGNLEEAVRLSHSIKGLAGTLGMLELQECSRELELLFRAAETAANGDASSLPEQADALKPEVADPATLQDNISAALDAFQQALQAVIQAKP